MDSKYRPKRLLTERKKIDEFIIDETLIRIGSPEYVWLWVAIEPKNKQILQIDISFERTMLVAERFIASLINTYGKYHVSTEMEALGIHKPVSF